MTTIYRPRVVDSTLATVANSLLRESGINTPTENETEEARRLAATIIRETLDALAGSDGLAYSTLTDVTDLVASDPETASVDQIREVAIALRGLLDLREALAEVGQR